jgi:hypothetical protein
MFMSGWGKYVSEITHLRSSQLQRPTTAYRATNRRHPHREIILYQKWQFKSSQHTQSASSRPSQFSSQGQILFVVRVYAPPRGGTSGREQRSKSPRQTNKRCSKKGASVTLNHCRKEALQKPATCADFSSSVSSVFNLTTTTLVGHFYPTHTFKEVQKYHYCA